MTNPEFLTALRAMASWYKQRPAAPAPSSDLHVYVHTTRLAQIAGAIGRADAIIDGPSVALRVTFGPHAWVEFFTEREQVCTRRVVGTRAVPERVIPQETIPAHTEEIVEWDCPEWLLAGHEHRDRPVPFAVGQG